MKRRRHTPEQIVRKLREVEWLLGEGQTIAEAAKQVEISEQTCHRWRNQYGADVRGRALGGWNFAIGWGWLGPLSLGAIADATSVPTALTLSGALLVVFAFAALAASSTLRAR